MIQIIKNYYPAILSGFVLFLSFPLPDLSFLAWMGFFPFIYSVAKSKSKGYSFKSGLIMGALFFFGTQYWIYHSIHHYGGVPFIPSICIVILLCLYQGLYTGLFGYLIKISYMKTGEAFILLVPSLWTLLEYIKSYLFTGFPWSLLGYSQYKIVPLIQIADFTGVYGISFLLVYSNTVLFKLYDSFKSKSNIRRALLHILLFILILTTTLSYGYKRVIDDEDGEKLVVTVVQGDIDQDKKWDVNYREKILEIYKSLTKKALKDKPQLIVWPETSLPFYFNYDTDYSKEFIDFQKSEVSTYLLFGTVLLRADNTDTISATNSNVLLSPDGKINFVYDKIHLVPFGEYVPLKGILSFINRLVEGIGEFAPGEVLATADTPIGKFATPICYEIIFPELIRDFYKYGGNFLINTTNDAWFGETSGPYQHFYMSVFRAVENRKPVIRAANSGISGFIDSKGRVISTTGLFERRIITETITKNSELTFYTVYGDIFVYICSIFTLFVIYKTRVVKFRTT